MFKRRVPVADPQAAEEGTRKRKKKVVISEAQPAVAEPTPIAVDATPAEPVVVAAAAATAPPPPPLPQWEVMRARVMRATERVRLTFHTANQIAARYGGIDGTAAFFAADQTVATGARGVASSSSGTQSNSNTIDDLLAANRNASSERLLKTGTRSTDALLADRDNVLSISDFVSKRLGLDSLDTLGRELFQKPYRVTGLSMTVPNAKWAQLEAQRAELELRRKKLVRQGRLFEDNRTHLAIEDEAEELARELSVFVPIEDVELIKPDAEVRAINSYWHNLLIEPLVALYRDVEETTLRSLRAAHGTNVDAADAEGIAALYLQRVAAPVFDQYLEQLRSSNFEDMPLTREILEDYFYRFMAHMIEWLLRLKRQQGEQARAALQQRVIDDAALNQPGGIARQAEEWQRVIDEDEEEPLFQAEASVFEALSEEERARRIGIAYLREALYIYATPVYEQWFESWLVLMKNDLGDELDENTELTLRRSLRNMIEGRERTRREREMRQARGLAPYEPMSQSAVVQSYTRLINNDLALRRIKKLEELAANEQLSTEIATALNPLAGGAEPSLTSDVLLHPRFDRFEILANEVAERRKQITDTFRISLENGDDGVMSDERWQRDKAALRAGGEAALQDLDNRAKTLRDQILYYSPLNGRAVGVHGPRDEPDGSGFSPHDLSYPIDITEARRQSGSTAAFVARFSRQFDADALHRRLERLRSVLSYDHAEQMVRRDLMRIEYILNHLTTPETEVAARIDRSLTSARPLVLSANLELRHELQLLTQMPSDLLIDDRVAEARRQLRETAWTVTWFFKPRYGDDSGTTREIAKEELPAGAIASTLSRPSMPDEPLALGGLYWVEFSDGTTTYRSEFTATVRVLAQCKRSGQTFEVGTEQHGDAVWREWPRDEKIRASAEEALVLVTRGDAAWQRLMEERASNERIRNSAQLPAESLFLPPWGGEDEASLMMAFHTLRKEDFQWRGIIGNVVERIGGQLRRELVAFADQQPETREALAPFIRASDMALFALIVDRRILARDTDAGDIIRAVQLHALQQAQRGAWSDKTVGGAEVLLRGMADSTLGDPLFANPAAYRPENLRVRLNDETLLAEARVQLELEDNVFHPDVLPFSAVQQLHWGYDRGVDELPLTTTLAALYTPAVFRNLTWREQRFIHAMHQRFENFARAFRMREREQLYFANTAGQQWSTRVPVSLADDWGNNMSDTRQDLRRQLGGAPQIPAIDNEIDRRLARATAQSIATQLTTRQFTGVLEESGNGFLRTQYVRSGVHADDNAMAAEDQRTFLLDAATWSEFKELLQQRLVRRGLVTVYEIAGLDGRQYTYDIKSDRRFDAAFTRAFSNRQTRQEWEGAFSHKTDQPDIYIVSLEGKASVVQRGSVPLDKGYDFRGIHTLIERTAREINGIDDDVALTRQGKTRARERLVRRFLDLVLAYNYFAFVAGPLTGRRVLMADELEELLDERGKFFARIGEAAGATGGTVLN